MKMCKECTNAPMPSQFRNEPVTEGCLKLTLMQPTELPGRPIKINISCLKIPSQRWHSSATKNGVGTQGSSPVASL